MEVKSSINQIKTVENINTILDQIEERLSEIENKIDELLYVASNKNVIRPLGHN
jgi:hypothetical protein